jgi:hypothetical protein
MLAAGQNIEPYKLIREIGRGGHGVVWLAERQSQITRIPVALKISDARLMDAAAIKCEADA